MILAFIGVSHARAQALTQEAKQYLSRSTYRQCLIPAQATPAWTLVS